MSMSELLAAFKQNSIELVDLMISFSKSGNPQLKTYFTTPKGILGLNKLRAIKTLIGVLPATTMIENFNVGIEWRDPGEKYTIRQFIISRDESYFLRSNYLKSLALEEDAGEIIDDIKRLTTQDEIHAILDYMNVYIDIIEAYRKTKLQK